MAATAAPIFIADMLQLLLVRGMPANWHKGESPATVDIVKLRTQQGNAECCIAVMLSLQRATVAGDANVPPHWVAPNAATCSQCEGDSQSSPPLPPTPVLST